MSKMKKEEKKKIINKIDLFFSYKKQKKISQLLAISFFILSFYKNDIRCIFLLLFIIFWCLSLYIHFFKMTPASLEVLYDKNLLYGKFIDKQKVFLYIILFLRRTNRENTLDDSDILFIENIKKIKNIKIKSTNKQ